MLAGLVALVVSAVTGLAAFVLLVLITLLAPVRAAAALLPANGGGPLFRLRAPARRLAAWPYGPARRLAAYRRRWAEHVPDTRRPPPGQTRDPGTRRPASDAAWDPGIPEPVREPSRRRLVVWLGVHSLAGPAPVAAVWGLMTALHYVLFRLHPLERSTLNTFALSTSIVALAVVVLVSVLLFRIGQARLTRALLDPPPAPEARIRELTASRAALVDAREAELRRIERDLHDGAQAKLIAIRMQLGLARGCPDPGETLRLIDEAREVAGQALTELRDLVRGIHPPVLADRGLTGAIEASALLCPMPVELDLDLPGRPQPPVESAVYFAVAEALTNVTKHSGASRAWVRLRHTAGVLRLTVGDDGRGGARIAGSTRGASGASDGARASGGGSGLRGIESRLSAFDGSLTVSSPPGGPTELTMEVPCALSSPKISPC